MAEAETAPATEAPAEAEAPAAPELPSREETIAKATEAAAAEEETEAPAEKPEAKAGDETEEGGEKKELPKPSAHAQIRVAERMRARRQQRKEQQAEHDAQAQVSAMRQERDETVAKFERRQQQAQEALNNGNAEEAVKLALGVPIEDLDKIRIEQRGKFARLSPEDQAKIKQMEAWQRQQEQERAELAKQQEQQAANHQYQQDLQEIASELKGSEFEQLQAVATKPYMVQGIYQQLAADADLTLEQAAVNLFPEFKQFWEELNELAPILGWETPQGVPDQPGVKAEATKAPVQTGESSEATGRGARKRKPPTSLPQSGAAEAASEEPPPANETPEQARARIVAKYTRLHQQGLIPGAEAG